MSKNTTLRNNFYIYEWFNIDTGEVFYVGKGANSRYKDTVNRNQYFKNYYNKYNCDVRKVKTGLKEKEAFKFEVKLIKKYRKINQCKCNLTDGGEGATFPLGSWNDLINKLKTLYYVREAMDEMFNEEDYDPDNLKTKSLEELQKLYKEYYEYKEEQQLYEDFKEDCKPFNSLPEDESELSAFEIETRNREIIMLTELISNNIISQNKEFFELSNCKTEIDYMCVDVDINKFISLFFEDTDYYIFLRSVILSNLWALKRIGRNPFANSYLKVKSFNIKNGFINIKFITEDDKKSKRIKIDLFDIVWGILVYKKNKPLLNILYEEIIISPFISIN